MKTIILGDTHGRTLWKDIVEKEKADRVIFIGDYFDTRESISAEHQIENFLDIVRFKQESGIEVILLIGNHDHHYFKDVGESGTSGYQRIPAFRISEELEKARPLLQMAYSFDNILCTHAGVSEEWLREQFNLKQEAEFTAERLARLVNKVWAERPKYGFLFNGYEPTGNDTFQTPIWIRPASLMRASENFTNQGVIQVVGHTGMKQISIDYGIEYGYFFIDTIGSRQYLIVEDGEFKIGKI